MLIHGLCRHVNEVPYARAKDIDFSSAKKLKEMLGQKGIYNSRKPPTIRQLLVLSSMQRASPHSKQEMDAGNWISFMPNSTSAKLKQFGYIN